RPIPIGPAAVILHVEPAGSVLVTRDLVHALAELWIGIGQEAGAHALVGRCEADTAIFAHVVTASRDTEVHPIPVAQNRVHAKPAVPRLPFPSVFVVADARNHLPRTRSEMATGERR